MPRGCAKSANSAIRAGGFFVTVFELGKELRGGGGRALEVWRTLEVEDIGGGGHWRWRTLENGGGHWKMVEDIGRWWRTWKMVEGMEGGGRAWKVANGHGSASGLGR